MRCSCGNDHFILRFRCRHHRGFGGAKVNNVVSRDHAKVYSGECYCCTYLAARWSEFRNGRDILTWSQSCPHQQIKQHVKSKIFHNWAIKDLKKFYSLTLKAIIKC